MREEYKIDWSAIDKMVCEAKKRAKSARHADYDRPIVHADIGYGGDTGE